MHRQLSAKFDTKTLIFYTIFIENETAGVKLAVFIHIRTFLMSELLRLCKIIKYAENWMSRIALYIISK
jgi:hypothetical protein